MPEDLVRDAEAFLQEARAYKEGDMARRMELLTKLEGMKRQLQEPMESMVSQWVGLNVVCSLNFMVETGVFEKMPLEEPISASELAKRASLPSSVITRLMRLLCGVGIISETGEDTYAHTSLSREYLPGHSVEFFRMCPPMFSTYLSLPSYFATHTEDDLTNPVKTPFSYGHNSEGKTFYEILRDNPGQGEIFNKSMKQQEPFLPTLGMYPFECLKSAVEREPSRPFIVDIGGGRGHMLEIIRSATENGFGARMILQDRPEVIASIGPDEIQGIERMSYDFFTEQPVKNAQVYYLRRIIHNYQDETCVQILKNTAKAMGKDSRVLIGEVVLPDRVPVGGEMTGYWKDIVMLMIGGRERSEKAFGKLLESAGLEMVKVWRFKTGEQGVVEGRLKQ